MNKGDILLVKYRLDLIGLIIRKFTHSNWNHVAWVIDDKTIIEATRKGVVIVPLKKYSNKIFYEVKLLRIRKLPNYKIENAMKRAFKMKRKRSYLKLLFTFLLIFLKIDKSLPRTTCSGLLAHCLSKVDWYFTRKKHPLLITPEDIDSSKNTIEVIYKL